MQLGDEAITEMYDLETIGKTVSEMNGTMGFRIARKYQIKEIFWEDNIISETTKHRARIWSALDKIRGDVKYRMSKWKLETQKEIILRKLKNVVRKDDWDQGLLTINERWDSFPEW
jgi:hypothetical protein